MKYFIAGTDTGVGKTYVTVLLSKYFKEKGYKVGVFKPVESGISSSIKPDYKLIAEAAGDIEKPFYNLSEPLAPYIAAKYDNISIDIDKIIDFVKNDSVKYQVYLIEGAGGLFVPITGNILLIDLIAKIGFQVILVARTNLGTVNHTLLSVEALEKRKIKIKDIFLNEVVKTSNKAVEENKSMIEKFSKYKINNVIYQNGNNVVNI